MSKSLLIISRQAPWSGPGAREALDVALAGGAFDLPIGLLFLDDGVFQLSGAQQPANLQQKDLSANLQALPMFGVEALYASQRSLDERGLGDYSSCLVVERLDDSSISTLIDRYNQVITL
ncbi:sulfurtransferase complex subunit TusC [Pseudomonas anguilliseptica]|uniref:tRNA 2-thiouridine synthesizing protein C n=1 Tax=Pseudomonas anguilliseptica TaxID=53406 RepID=A0A1H5GFL2_PSEAG|nr:sulfurtransferase complex subunit TusC [Pseudomonas anguilliseptica]SEE13958.1 tRNA 2-thiouridine synthesizing protein C [Pseudomonas anguilliseptica]